MMDLIDKIREEATLVRVLCVIFGILLIVWPGATVVLVMRIIGIILLVSAVVTAVRAFHAKDTRALLGDWIRAAVFCIFGIWIVTGPRIFLVVIPFIAGIFLIYMAVRRIVYRSRRKGGFGAKDIVGIVVMLVIGVLCIAHPWSAVKIILVFVGIGLVLAGIFGIPRKNGKDKYSKNVFDTDYKEI